MNMEDYLQGLEAGLSDAKQGANLLEESLRYIVNSGLDINQTAFTQGYNTGQAHINSTC